jgi:hypothetical protein
VLLGARANLVQPLFRRLECSVEALDLRRYPFIGNDAVADVRNFPPQKVDWSVHDPG